MSGVLVHGEPAMKPLFRRRRLLIDALQYRLLAVNALYVCACLAILIRVLFGPPVVALLSGDVSTDARRVRSSQQVSGHCASRLTRDGLSRSAATASASGSKPRVCVSGCGQ